MRCLSYLLVLLLTTLTFNISFAGVDSLFQVLDKALANETEEGEKKAVLLYEEIGIYYFDAYNLDSSITIFGAMKEYCEGIGDVEGMATAHFNICKAYVYKSDYKTALLNATRAAELFEEVGNQQWVAASYTAMGNIHLQQSDTESALEYYTRSVAVKETINDTFGLSQAYHNMAITYYMRDDGKGVKMDSAKFFFKKALSLLHQMSAAEERVGLAKLSSLHGLVSMQIVDGEHEKALPGLQDLIAIHRASDNKPELMRVLNNAGIANKNLGRYNAALDCYDESLALAKELDDREMVKDIYSSYLDLYKSKGEYMKAFDYVKLFVDAKDSLLNKESREALSDIRTRYETEKTERENEGLKHDLELTEKENEIQSLELNRTYYAIFGLIALLILGGVILILLLQRGRLKTQHKIVELEQKALRAQMNPHFFFNALNSIQSCILHEDKMVAYEYHAKFAKLMRATLINSASKSIAINDELTALKLYMDLEALRLDQKFVYEIEVDEQLDGEKDQIPTMLLQPYIENAIWHGVMHRKTQGTIWLKLQLEADHLKCVVEDNGVGRKQSRAMKAQHGESHQSMGMEVTKERLELYNLEHKSKMSVSIIDLEDAAGSLGTRIELFIPKETLKQTHKTS